MLNDKSLNSLAPQHLMELFTNCCERNGLNFRSDEINLQIPLPRTSIGQKRLLL